MARVGTVRIGISGWTYPPWRGVFYPKGLPQTRELDYATSQFNTLEINGTFYGMQRPDAFADWAARAPDGFIYAVKGPRYLTHMLKLRSPEAPLANFIASGLLRLGSKLGPILWQFPPQFRFDADRIEPQETPLRGPGRPSSPGMNLGTRNNDIPRVPGGASGSFASTRCSMFSPRSCSPAEMKIFVPVMR